MRPFKFCFTSLNRFMVIRVQNLNLSKLSKIIIEEGHSKTSHNSLQDNVKSQHFLRVFKQFFTPRMK